MQTVVNLHPLPAHPPPGPLFADWFKGLSAILATIATADVLSPEFKKIAVSICTLKNEVIYECESRADRSETSVYDRSDYVVRELLRTTKINNVLQYVRDTSSLFASGRLSFSDDGILLLDESTKVEPFLATTLLIEVPTILSLCFTAQETIGTINIADVLKISSEIIGFGSKRISFALTVAPSQQSIFSAVIMMLTSCLDNLKVLNTKLFFTAFEEEKLFLKLVEFALQANKENQSHPLNIAISCMSAYIQSSQSEHDRKALEIDGKFVAAYKKMMDEVINPKLKESKCNRSQFRSILFFSRSLRV